jgi:large subunit ribosomal protein LP1
MTPGLHQQQSKFELKNSPWASSDIAATYDALIQADDGIEITVRPSPSCPPSITPSSLRVSSVRKIIALTNAANVELEPIWASLLAKALEGNDVRDLLSNVGSVGGAPVAGSAVPAAEAPKGEAKEEDDDMVRFVVDRAFYLMLISFRFRLQGFGLFD